MKYLTLVFFFAMCGAVLADDTTIEMLDKLGSEYMVFSEKVSYINSGDTIYWKATDKGHNVEFIKGAVPEGVQSFRSKMGKDTEYKFTIPGIYAYWCTPHKSMGMVGFVVVGNDLSNIVSIKDVKYIGRSKKVAKELLDEIS